MSQIIQLNDVAGYMRRHLTDVFDTMLAMTAEFMPAAGLPSTKDRVTGSVGFAGDDVHGAVYLHLPAPFAIQAAAAMLGLPLEEITGDAEVNDVVGEMTNMLTGGLKSWLCDAGRPCAVSTPAIIRGAYVIEPLPEVEREFLVFDCNGTHIVVEVHIKLS